MPRNARRPSAKDRAWSYSTGERRTNRVRAYDRGAKGLYVEWFEAGERSTDARRRVRLALGHTDRELAKAKADEIALAFRTHDPRKPIALTLETLFAQYETEVTPTKGEGTQAHDRRCFAMFLKAFGKTRKPQTLSRREWDRFISDRRAGRVAPTVLETPRRVGNRIVESDLRLLNAVMNWATRASDGRGGVLLDRNPFSGLTVPKEENPKRAVVSAEQYQALAGAAAEMGRRAALFLTLAHETGHRAASIRHLRWSDIDLERRRVTWRGEHDKIGLTHTTPLTEAAAIALGATQRELAAIGDAWVFAKGL